MLKIGRSRDRFIFNKGSPTPGKMVFILRRGPGHNRMAFSLNFGVKAFFKFRAKLTRRAKLPYLMVYNLNRCIAGFMNPEVKL